MPSSGMSESEILAGYPHLERADIPGSLAFAADAVRLNRSPFDG
jgi:uncharacterized protein (DUF433 family)